MYPLYRSEGIREKKFRAERENVDYKLYTLSLPISFLFPIVFVIVVVVYLEMALGAQIETSETGGDNAKIPLLNSDQEHETTEETIGEYPECVLSLLVRATVLVFKVNQRERRVLTCSRYVILL